MEREYGMKAKGSRRNSPFKVLGTSLVVGSMMLVFFVYLIFQILGMNEFY